MRIKFTFIIMIVFVGQACLGLFCQLYSQGNNKNYFTVRNVMNSSNNKESLAINFPAKNKTFNGHVKRWEVFEIELEAKQQYQNPYQQDILLATFSGPTKTYVIPGFWDGGNTWKVRISPSEVGTWTYHTESTDPGLNINGSFNCVNNISKHGGIEAMQGFPYHFQYQDGTPFWWFGETCWTGFFYNSAEKLTTETFKNYIDVRASQGFNYIHANLLLGLNEGGQPFIGDIGNKINPSFWQVVDERVKYMNEKGITSGLMLAWKKAGNLDWTQFPDQVSRKRYGKYVASRYGAYNVVFVLSGEYDESPESHPNSFSDWKEIANAVNEGDPYNRMVAIHPSTRSAEEFADESWIDFGDYMQIYENLHELILQCRDHNKPVVNSEYAYFLVDFDGDGVVDKPNSATREDFRYASWDIAMAGGYFVTGFRATYLGGFDYIGPFNGNDPESDLAEIDLQNIKLFFNEYEWWKFNPGDNLVSGQGVHYCLKNGTDEYIVYIRNTNNAVILDFGTSSPDEYSIKRYNTRDGSFNYLGNYSANTSLSLFPPNDDDWVFYISKKPPLNISGNVIYYSNSRPIQDAAIKLFGNQSQTILSNSEGYYNFLNLNHCENYTIKVSKPVGEDIGLFTITAYDAAITAQTAILMRNLTFFEAIAADANMDGNIHTYDAALILQYSVGLQNISGSHVGEWVFKPDSRSYQPLISDQTRQDFTGTIIGNVRGGWSQPTNLSKINISFKPYKELSDLDVYLDDEIIIPLKIKGTKEILSANIDLFYDPEVLQFENIIKTEISKNFQIVTNNERGRLRVGLYSIEPLSDPGIFIKLKFKVINEATTQKSYLNLERFQLNNSVFMQAQSELNLIRKNELPKEFCLSQNYPNPFIITGNSMLSGNDHTSINYKISKAGKVSIIIYNYLGQKIKTFINEEKEPGSYTLHWDGRNENGELISSGIYYYRLLLDKKTIIRKMIVL